MKKYKHIIFAILSVFVFMFISCDSNRVYQKYIKIDNYIWDADESIEFEFDIEDTVSIHNLYVNVRHSGRYPFRNLWLFISSTAPNGMTEIDTLECTFADKSGKWLGDGSGDLWDNKFLWKQFVRFPMQGTYSVKYKQGMRIHFLPGILDVGFRVEKIDREF